MLLLKRLLKILSVVLKVPSARAGQFLVTASLSLSQPWSRVVPTHAHAPSHSPGAAWSPHTHMPCMHTLLPYSCRALFPTLRWGLRIQVSGQGCAGPWYNSQHRIIKNNNKPIPYVIIHDFKRKKKQLKSTLPKTFKCTHSVRHS